jgi:hypothetical protein
LRRQAKVGELAAVVATLSSGALPSVTELVLTGLSRMVWPEWTGAKVEPVREADDLDVVCAALGGWLGQLTRLALLDGAMTDAGIAALARGLGGRKLARLDLTGTPMPIAARGELVKLCDELVFPDAIVAPDAELWVEHANKPEWGRGRIVRRFEGKLEIEFPEVGSKVFKADAAFLRLGS